MKIIKLKYILKLKITSKKTTLKTKVFFYVKLKYIEDL